MNFTKFLHSENDGELNRVIIAVVVLGIVLGAVAGISTGNIIDAYPIILLVYAVGFVMFLIVRFLQWLVPPPPKTQ